MSSLPPSIYYFMMGNFLTHIEIGTYTENPIIDTNQENIPSSSSDIKKVKLKCQNIFYNLNEENSKNKKNKEIFDNYKIFYFLTSTNTFYIAVIEKNSFYYEEENLIFELFEDIDHQGIKKLIDNKTGQLMRVGKQNLKFCIEKEKESIKKKFIENNNYFFDNKKKNNDQKNNINESESTGISVGINVNSSEKNDYTDGSKISLLNKEITDVKNDVKNSVKNMINNVSDMKNLNEKSVKIKDLAYQFQKDSFDLEKKMKWQKMKKQVIGICIGICAFIIFNWILLS